MTDGSSQGLFVVVAVVIFGIFVAISYSLFNGYLQPALANIFNDTLDMAENELGIATKRFKEYHTSFEYNRKTKEYLINTKGEDSLVGNDYPRGIYSVDSYIIPWGYKLIISYDVFFEHESPEAVAYSGFDFNSFLEKGNEGVWNGNDNYGERSQNQTKVAVVKANTWTTVTGFYSNNNPKNINKVDLYEGCFGNTSWGTLIGLRMLEVVSLKISEYKMKNIQYKVVPI